MDPLFILLVGIVVVVGGIIVLRLHAFISLILAAYVVALLTPVSAIKQFALESGMSAGKAVQMAHSSIGERIAIAFGNNVAEIGILIAMAAIIGKCLLESGGAERIVRSVVKITGINKSPIAFAGSSFFLSIPVFFDTVFYLMIPLAKAMAMRIGKNYLLLVLAIAAGGTMAHTLVPPTPGPLFIASAMGIPIYMMMIGGTLVGLFTVTSGYLYASWTNVTWPVPLRDSPEAPLKAMKAQVSEGTGNLPGLWLSVLPIVIPLVFITARGILGSIFDIGAAVTSHALLGGLLAVITFVGEKNTALVVGGLIALMMLGRYKEGTKKDMAKSIQGALMSGGIIILITAAGGAFGAMLQQTGISTRLAELTGGFQLALIPLAFVITAVIKTAQGSSTVSMITAAGIMAGMVSSTQLDYHILYLGLAVGCGSTVFSWMNDSGFWVITKMSNLTEQESLKTFSVMTAIMGCTGLVVILIAAWLFPLV